MVEGSVVSVASSVGGGAVNPKEHYEAAERCLALAAGHPANNDETNPAAALLIAEAQVHATLATYTPPAAQYAVDGDRDFFFTDKPAVSSELAAELQQLTADLGKRGAPSVLTDERLSRFFAGRKWMLLRSTADERFVSVAVEVSPDRFVTITHDPQVSPWSVTL